MSILQKLMLMLPHVEFESPELKARFDDFISELDKDMDGSGFDTSTITDERFEALEDCWEQIENDIVIEVREATDEEQEQLNALEEEFEKDDAEADAEATATANGDEQGEQEEGEEGEEGAEATEEESTVLALVDIEEETVVVNGDEEDEDLDDDEDEFEHELEDEIAEQKQMAELAEKERKLKGENAPESA